MVSSSSTSTLRASTNNTPHNSSTPSSTAAPRKHRSSEEPPALRITNADAHPADGVSTSSYQFSPENNSPFTRAQHESPFAQPQSDSSWLPSTDLLSPTFNAHHFLQRLLSHSFDKSARPTRIPQLDDAFDADAALAALDTVESALRRRRDAARREELSARDDLRAALLLSAKRRDALIRTVHNVTSHVTTYGDVGRQAASALRTDLSALTSSFDHLANLRNARDLLSLLARQHSQLDAVRVSKLLSSANDLIQAGRLDDILPPHDLQRAFSDISRCRSELTDRIFEWMKKAADDDNPSIIAECALAAEQLHVSDRFVQAYVDHVFTFDKYTQTPDAFDQSADQVLEPFRNSCWEALDLVRENLHHVLEAFGNPAQPLAVLLKAVGEKKVLPVADAILSGLLATIRNTEGVLADLKSSSVEMSSLPTEVANEGRRRSSLERMRSLAIADSKESWRENATRLSDDRRKFLIVSAHIVTALAKLKADLLDVCRTPGANVVDKSFAGLQDPFQGFVERFLVRFLDVQKRWIDDRLGAAFFDITRIDLHAPRLAPRERSHSDVYHRYRAFYGHVSSSFFQMTQRAIQSTYESIGRTIAVLNNIPIGEEPVQNASVSSSAHDDGNGYEPASPTSAVHEDEESNPSPLRNATDGNGNGHGRSTSTCGFSIRNPKSLAEMRVVIRELLDNLVMNYLANAETLLQAATHLLPVCEEDARMAQLWMSGASPLTAYLQAIDVLSRSNECLHEFVLSVSVEREVTDVQACDTVLPACEQSLGKFFPQETREVLHRELTSGLTDLAAEAEVGVHAAVSSLRARLFAMLTSVQATQAYCGESGGGSSGGGGGDGGGGGGDERVDELMEASLDGEPSETFISASSLVEQELQSVVRSMTGGNKQLVVAELTGMAREAVLHCWCSIQGAVSVGGASQMMADGKAVVRVFRDSGVCGEVLECLPAIGQLFLEDAVGLWCCVESKALANVDADVIVRLLRKRDDFKSERVVKVCQSLGAEIELLKEEDEDAQEST